MERMRLAALRPSQFYISEEKLRRVRAWLDPADLSGFEPLPVKWLDGQPVLTDGHTRACAAALAGLTEIPVCEETDALDWKAYRRCVAEARVRGVRCALDLTARVVSEEDYQRLWYQWCDALHRELEERSMDELVFITPDESREAEVWDYLAEFDRDGSHIHGSGGLDDFRGDYAGWLRYLAERARDVPENEVPGPTFLVVRKADGHLVGTVNIRTRLSAEMLRTGGHVGYSVRPAERLRGYGTELLRMALAWLRGAGLTRALVTCDTVNEGSAGVIRKNGGVFENEEREDDGTPVSRYWIAL